MSLLLFNEDEHNSEKHPEMWQYLVDPVTGRAFLRDKNSGAFKKEKRSIRLNRRRGKVDRRHHYRKGPSKRRNDLGSLRRQSIPMTPLSYANQTHIIANPFGPPHFHNNLRSKNRLSKVNEAARSAALRQRINPPGTILSYKHITSVKQISKTHKQKHMRKRTYQKQQQLHKIDNLKLPISQNCKINFLDPTIKERSKHNWSAGSVDPDWGHSPRIQKDIREKQNKIKERYIRYQCKMIPTPSFVSNDGRNASDINFSTKFELALSKGPKSFQVSPVGSPLHFDPSRNQRSKVSDKNSDSLSKIETLENKHSWLFQQKKFGNKEDNQSSSNDIDECKIQDIPPHSLQQWARTFDIEKAHFKSTSHWCRMKFDEALQLTVSQPRPSRALSCMTLMLLYEMKLQFCQASPCFVVALLELMDSLYQMPKRKDKFRQKNITNVMSRGTQVFDDAISTISKIRPGWHKPGANYSKSDRISIMDEMRAILSQGAQKYGIRPELQPSDDVTFSGTLSGISGNTINPSIYFDERRVELFLKKSTSFFERIRAFKKELRKEESLKVKLLEAFAYRKRLSAAEHEAVSRSMTCWTFATKLFIFNKWCQSASKDSRLRQDAMFSKLLNKYTSGKFGIRKLFKAWKFFSRYEKKSKEDSRWKVRENYRLEVKMKLSISQENTQRALTKLESLSIEKEEISNELDEALIRLRSPPRQPATFRKIIQCMCTSVQNLASSLFKESEMQVLEMNKQGKLGSTGIGVSTISPLYKYRVPTEEFPVLDHDLDIMKVFEEADRNRGLSMKDHDISSRENIEKMINEWKPGLFRHQTREHTHCFENFNTNAGRILLSFVNYHLRRTKLDGKNLSKSLNNLHPGLLPVSSFIKSINSSKRSPWKDMHHFSLFYLKLLYLQQGMHNQIKNNISEHKVIHKVGIKICRGVNLPIGDEKTMNSDPYIRFSYRDCAFSTKKMRKTLNPEWEEEFQLNWFQSSESQTNENSQNRIYFFVMDADVMSEDDILGYVPLDLTTIISPIIKSYHKTEYTGEIWRSEKLVLPLRPVPESIANSVDKKNIGIIMNKTEQSAVWSRSKGWGHRITTDERDNMKYPHGKLEIEISFHGCDDQSGWKLDEKHVEKVDLVSSNIINEDEKNVDNYIDTIPNSSLFASELHYRNLHFSTNNRCRAMFADAASLGINFTRALQKPDSLTCVKDPPTATEKAIQEKRLRRIAKREKETGIITLVLTKYMGMRLHVEATTGPKLFALLSETLLKSAFIKPWIPTHCQVCNIGDAVSDIWFKQVYPLLQKLSFLDPNESSFVSDTKTIGRVKSCFIKNVIILQKRLSKCYDDRHEYTNLADSLHFQSWQGLCTTVLSRRFKEEQVLDDGTYTNVPKIQIENVFHRLGVDDEETRDNTCLAIQKIFKRRIKDLKTIFQFYAAANVDSGSVGGMDHGEWWKLCKDCKFCSNRKRVPSYRIDLVFNCANLDYSIKEKMARRDADDGELDPTEFIEALVRVASYKYVKIPLAMRLDKLINEDILPNACSIDIDVFRDRIESDEVQEKYKRYKRQLKTIYTEYAADDDAGDAVLALDTMNCTELVTMCTELKLLGPTVGQRSIRTVFAYSQQEEELLDDEADDDLLGDSECCYTEFKEIIGALTHYFRPDPYVVLSDRLSSWCKKELFVKAMGLPRFRSMLRKLECREPGGMLADGSIYASK